MSNPSSNTIEEDINLLIGYITKQPALKEQFIALHKIRNIVPITELKILTAGLLLQIAFFLEIEERAGPLAEYVQARYNELVNEFNDFTDRLLQ
jgi:hypothetical protein